mgnify:CR=1 FL=1
MEFISYQEDRASRIVRRSLHGLQLMGSLGFLAALFAPPQYLTTILIVGFVLAGSLFLMGVVAGHKGLAQLQIQRELDERAQLGTPAAYWGGSAGARW